jgi:hypothetical protein
MLLSKRGTHFNLNNSNARIEEFSSLPSAKLTVDEFREIWFQNSADPPSFAQPHPKAEIEDTSSERGGSEAPETVEARVTSDDENRNPDEIEADTQVVEAEAEFLEDLVADHALEDEINQHLGHNEFQQALAEMEGM